MKLYGLIGYPLEHSFSKGWFDRQFAAEGIRDAEYHNFPLSSIEELPALMRENSELAGFNVTAPYKVSVIDYLDEIDDTALQIGAVNCVTKEGNRWIGHNVDWIGFADSLHEFIRQQTLQALILGSGGASKAAAYALQQLSIEFLTISRTIQDAGYFTYSELTPAIINSHKLIINTTPLGTYPNTIAYPPFPYDLLTTEHLLYDMVYNPPHTEFMKRGEKAGARTTNGTRMLELQAEQSLQLFRLRK